MVLVVSLDNPLSAIKLHQTLKGYIFGRFITKPCSFFSRPDSIGSGYPLRFTNFAAMEMISRVLGVEEYTSLVNDKKPVLVDFSATWCEPCVLLDEILTDLEKRLGSKVRIIKLDADEQTELTTHFGFRSVPWLLIYKDGVEKWRMHGFMLAPELEKLLQTFLPK
jgi:thioredoxin 1